MLFDHYCHNTCRLSHPHPHPFKRFFTELQQIKGAVNGYTNKQQQTTGKYPKRFSCQPRNIFLQLMVHTQRANMAATTQGCIQSNRTQDNSFGSQVRFGSGGVVFWRLRRFCEKVVGQRIAVRYFEASVREGCCTVWVGSGTFSQVLICS